MSREISVREIDERTRRQIIRLSPSMPNVKQLADHLGIDPQDVMTVRQELRESFDAISVEEMVAKAFMDLNDVTNHAMQEFLSTDDARSKAPLLSAAVTATKTSMQMLEKWHQKNQGAVDALNAKRQKELGAALDKMAHIAAETLADGNPHTKEEVLEAMLSGLIQAVSEMESRNGL